MISQAEAGSVPYRSAAGRWLLAATVLGSGMAFLDATVVNVALPAIGRDLGTPLSGLQWVMDAYLVTLSALLLVGGSLGDRLGRRRTFALGMGGFVVASLLCGLAPSAGALVLARALQGAAGALLIPGSLALISASFSPADRAQAVGAWSGLAGVTTALGPFLGGWLIDAGGWRLIFLLNLPIAAAAIAITLRHVPESRDPDPGRLDLPGAILICGGLAAIAYALIERGGAIIGVALLGAALVVGFAARESLTDHPMLPLGLFRSRQFSGANLTTLAVYAALSVALFLVVLRLQLTLGYSALAAGASLAPFTALMLLLSPSAGRLAQRLGPRLPMTAGPLLAAAGLVLFSAIGPGDGFATRVLPAVLVFGLGMVLTVAPLTSAVFAAVDSRHAGVASGVNNAIARLAGLLAIAVVPTLAGIDRGGDLRRGLEHGYSGALLLSASLCAAGALASVSLVRGGARMRPVFHPSPTHACHDGCLCHAQPGRADA